jgi:hypothetical protein
MQNHWQVLEVILTASVGLCLLVVGLIAAIEIHDRVAGGRE